MSKQKEKLFRKLKQVVAREEEVIRRNDSSAEDRRSCCMEIMDTLDEFLGSWEELEDPSLDLPCDNYLRQTLSDMVRELGPGDSQLRESLLATLQSTVKSTECRQIILDFLPVMLPLRADKETKSGMLQTLKHLLEEDSTALAPILDCLSSIGRSGKLEKSRIFRFTLDTLSRVSECDVHRPIKTLVEHIMNETDAKIAVEAVRTELRSVEEFDSPASDACIVATAQVMASLQGNNDLFFETFLVQLGEISRDSETDLDGDDGLIVSDLIVLLLHNEHPKHCEQVENIFDTAVERSGLTRQALFSLIRIATGQDAPENTRGSVDSEPCNLFTFLFNPLIGLSIFLLLAPIRLRSFDVIDGIVALSKDFTVKLFLNLDQERQGRLVSSLLHLDDDLSDNLKDANTAELVSQGSQARNRSAAANIHVVSCNVFDVLATVAKDVPQLVAPFKRALFQKLTMGEHNHDTVRHLCALISCIRSPSVNEELEFTEAFLAVRSLLFSPSNVLPSDSEQDIDRSVRGLILAVEIISSGHLTQANALTIWQSVRAVLLPPTNRIVHPKIGLYGLTVVRALHKWDRKNKKNIKVFTVDKEIFQTMTHVLTKSRMVQYVSSYSERNKDGVTLGYIKRPGCFESEAKKRKFRKMVFCFDALLRERNLARPRNWQDASRWVFDLVNTYLVLGRRSSSASDSPSKSKWIPHAWVEAAFEFPSVDLSRLKASGASQRRVLDLIREAVSDYDISSCHDVLPDFVEKDFCEMIKHLKKSRDRVEMMQAFLRCALSFVLGSALSAAILSNTYERYRRTLNDQDNQILFQERTEAVRLIQYQLFKIYGLQRKCRVLERVFRGIGVTNRKSKELSRKRQRGKKRPASRPLVEDLVSFVYSVIVIKVDQRDRF
jgi:hypothetical protein